MRRSGRVPQILEESGRLSLMRTSNGIVLSGGIDSSAIVRVMADKMIRPAMQPFRSRSRIGVTMSSRFARCAEGIGAVPPRSHRQIRIWFGRSAARLQEDSRLRITLCTAVSVGPGAKHVTSSDRRRQVELMAGYGKYPRVFLGTGAGTSTNACCRR